jgi:3-dehydroquinate dehydratase-1
MVCVSIGDVSLEECLAILKEVDFAEIRLDRIKIPKEAVGKIFSSHKNLIATFKDGNVPETIREEFLIEAVENGASYVDVDLNSREGFVSAISQRAREKGIKLIVSYHNFEGTDEFALLKKVAHMCLSLGDYGKISCMVNEDEDNLTLLNLVKLREFKGRLIVTGMGEKGKITRILSPILGSPFTFACYRKGKEMASGQIEARILSKMISLLQEP